MLHGDTTVETATPDELVQRWAARTGIHARVPGVAQRDAYVSERRRDVVFEDDAGRTWAMLTYEKHPTLGWRLQRVAECG